MSESKHEWKRHIKGLIISIAIAEGVGILGAIFTRDAMKKYKELVHPSFSPPGWVFPVVWSILFLLMGIASYMVYVKGFRNPEVKGALGFYAVQLVFNFFWTIIYFRLGLRGFAFLWILILLALVVITALKFYKIEKAAGYLMIPYILWVSFASVLNFAIWQLNK